MWADSADTLILVLTYRCNLKCRYCPTKKFNADISHDVLYAAIDKLILPQQSTIKTVRFFGAEPLMKQNAIFDFVQTLAKKLPQHKFNALKFSITTNGTLISEQFLNFVKSQPKMELVLSIDGPPDVQLANRPALNNKESQNDSASWINTVIPYVNKLSPPIVINQTISPQLSNRLIESFVWIYNLGFRKFNFLPAYYVPWSTTQINTLKSQFDQLADIIIKMWKKNLSISVRNMFINAEDTFFNRALVVDVDGKIYSSTAMLTARIWPYRNQLSIGSLLNDSTPQSNNYNTNVQKIISNIYPKHLIESTKKVDILLDEFVLRLTNAKREIAYERI